MKRIKKMVAMIDDELHDAEKYSDMYIQAKIDGNPNAPKYKEMALDELKHAGYVHQIAVTEIDKARKIVTPPQDMLDKWESEHAVYIAKSEEIKKNLAL